MPIKFLVLGGVGVSCKGGVEVPILFLWSRGFFGASRAHTKGVMQQHAAKKRGSKRFLNETGMSEKLQNESSPNLSNYCPEFCSEYSPNLFLQFPNAVVLNAVVRRNTQISAKGRTPQRAQR